ncbi:hypothetical protein P5673_008551 [Acropora cervicornis]|uniref:Uncharacterized protein n=1 Tax=Acropora cervicornis TaxID=6130 RepID=A0AAD9VAZ8_ACRCE|nr:hypothetical protein P5673_008551 [Acropora cervicornis]
MSICPRHRDSFGIRWRCKKKFCAVPPSWAPHRARQLRGDRSITFIQSKLIFKMTSTLVPVGSPICRLCLGLLSSPNPMIPEIQIESAVSEESTGESSSKPAPKTTSPSPPGESTENETDDEIISRSDEARSDSLCEAMENVAIISDDTSLYVAKETGPSSSDLSEDSRDTANLFLRRAKLNEFLVASGKAVVAQPKKPWSQMLDARTKQVYIDKAKDAVVAALEVIIPDDAGVPNRLPQGFKAELSQGDFISCSKGKSVLSTIPEQIDIEEVEEDASGLLPCPVDGCVCTYQSFRNLERHLLVGKCKMIPEKHTLLDAAKLSYVKKVEEGDKKEIFKDNFPYSSYLLGGSYSLKLNRFQSGSLFAGVGVVIT